MMMKLVVLMPYTRLMWRHIKGGQIMKKWKIVAYPEVDGNYYLPRQEKEIFAKDRDEAISKAWREFPEYHEVNAFEVVE